MDQKITDLSYPLRGLDLQTAFGVQRPGTTPCCQNCLSHEPCAGRSRGGRRPGLASLDGRTAAGRSVVQHINEIVIGSTASLFPTDYPWRGQTIDFTPSGPPWIYPGIPITIGWDGSPIEDSGSGGGPGPFTKKKRRRGSGIQPNPNQLTYSPPAIGSYRMFQAAGQVTITEPGPFFGTSPTFNACMCIPTLYLTLAGAPTDARQFNGWWCQKAYFFNLNSIPQGSYTFLGSLITGTTVGPVTGWGVRACNGSGNFDFPCVDGYSVLDNVGALGLALCCTRLLLAPRETTYPLTPGSAGLEPLQDEEDCRAAGGA